MPRPSRLGLALAATVAASSLFVGGGLAAAAEPGPDSPECKTATEDLRAAKVATDASPEDAARKSAYEQAKAAATTACTAPSSSSSSQSSSASSSSPKPSEPKRPPREQGGPPREGGGDRNGDGRNDDDQDGPAGDDKDCDDFMSQPEAQKYFDEVGTDDNPDPSRLDRDNDGKACESLADVDGDASKLPAKIDGKTLINQTDDDDSEAKVSGSQVKDVPEGSVDTGSAQ